MGGKFDKFLPEREALTLIADRQEEFLQWLHKGKHRAAAEMRRLADQHKTTLPEVVGHLTDMRLLAVVNAFLGTRHRR